MPTYSIYSKRKKNTDKCSADAYIYDNIPQNFKVQIVQILNDVLGNDSLFLKYKEVKGVYKAIVTVLRREYGVFELAKKQNLRDERFNIELFNFILTEKDPDKIIDAIELSFKLIDKATRCLSYRDRKDFNEAADDAIAELNHRFDEHGLGYRFHNNTVIRVDSELIHSDIVSPALRLLSSPMYAGAQEEYFNAQSHYRHQNYKESLNDCLKSFESTMKAICAKRGWIINEHATSKQLIEVCFDNGLVPKFWAAHFSALRSTLESSVPTCRNKLSGHGQGVVKTEVPDYIVSYMLHMTASIILFLSDADNNMP